MVDRCISCGEYVPEGRQICHTCANDGRCKICNRLVPEGIDVCDSCELKNETRGGLRKMSETKFKYKGSGLVKDSKKKFKEAYEE